MKRVLAAALAAVPLLAVATPAAAAPPVRLVQTECTGDPFIMISCYTVDYTFKTEITPSGNAIIWQSGTSTLVQTNSDGSVHFSDSQTYRGRWVIKPGDEEEPHLTYLRNTYTWVSGDLTCTETMRYKVTNGQLQIEDYDSFCNF